MNKNKLIFSIIGGVLLLLIILFVVSLNKSSNTEVGSTKSKDFKIWIVGDNKTKFENFVSDFKTINTKYKTKNVVVESFSDYEEYYLALSSAISSGEAPDIFVLNNNEETSIFEGQILGLDPELFNANDFRKKYKSVFSDDLVFTYMDGEKEKEALAGIPIGYETLGIFYNGRYVNSSDLEYVSSLNAIISELKETKANYTPIGIGNGSTVYDAADIVTQFFMLENGVDELEDLKGNTLKESLGTYLYYGDESSDNSYNSRFSELKKLGDNNLDLFSNGELFMIVGYPRMIEQIDEKGYSTSLLRASAFPHYFSGEGKTLINYNYFVVNKNTSDLDFSYDFMTYLMSDSGAENYLEKYTYYLPALLSLESDKLDSKIHEDYKIYLSDFYNNNYLLSSFDKKIKNLYDRNIISILDNSTNYETEFNNFRDKLICQSDKIINLENLSRDCN